MNERLIKSTLIAISAILHDIGKVSQRAGLLLSAKHKNNEEQILAIHTANFLERLLYQKGCKINEKWKTMFKAFPEDIVTTSALHHNPPIGNICAKIIQKADWIASGLDRDKKEECEEGKTFKEVCLKPILSNVRIHIPHDDDGLRLRPLPFSLQNFTPQKGIKAEKKDYIELVKKLEEGFNILLDKYNTNNDDMALSYLADGLDTLLMLNMMNLPASTCENYDDVSLYDHSKTTSAFASALYNYHGDDTSHLFDDEGKKFLLIRGEFFSIQKFLFNEQMSNKNTAKILRGKSFYVSLMTEIASTIVLDRLNLPIFNLMINSAGHFVILADNSVGNIDILKSIKSEINKWLYTKYYGQVSFGLSYIETTGEDYRLEKFSDTWIKLLENADEEKLHKFDLHKSDMKANITDFADKISNGVCSICNIFPKLPEKDMCGNCMDYEKLGEDLLKCDNLYFYKDKKYGFFGELSYTFDSKIKGIIRSTAIDIDKGFGGGRIVNYKCYVDTGSEGEVTSFEKLAESNGANLLGVLKADVDNLGVIFAYGLSYDEQAGIKNKLTFSRLAMMSRDIHFFFSYWLNRLIEQHNFSIYTVFAGGDDLFLVGAYSDIYELSLKIANEFKRYVGNDEITLSAGIGLFSPNTPIYFMANETEALLESSKHSGKNRLAIFESVAKWSEYKDYSDRFNNLKLDKMPTAFFYKLIELADMSKRYNDNKTVADLMWRPRLKYMAVRSGINDYIIAELSKMLEDNPMLLKTMIVLNLYKSRGARR